MLAARNLVLGARHDLWSVNTDHEYHEEQAVGSTSRADGADLVARARDEILPRVPRRIGDSGQVAP